MKNFLKGFLYFVVGCAIVGVIIGYMIGTFPAYSFMARTFLTAVSKDQYDQAYSLLSPDFQARNNLPAFKENILASGLDQYKSALWGKDFMAPDQKSGFVIGTVLTKENLHIIVRFQFVKLHGKDWNDNGWRIDNITFPQEQQEQQEQKK